MALNHEAESNSDADPSSERLREVIRQSLQFSESGIPMDNQPEIVRQILEGLVIGKTELELPRYPELGLLHRWEDEDLEEGAEETVLASFRVLEDETPVVNYSPRLLRSYSAFLSRDYNNVTVIQYTPRQVTFHELRHYWQYLRGSVADDLLEKDAIECSSRLEAKAKMASGRSNSLVQGMVEFIARGEEV